MQWSCRGGCTRLTPLVHLAECLVKPSHRARAAVWRLDCRSAYGTAAQLIAGVSLPLVKRMVPTPFGMTELDVAGSGRHVFVTVTVFGEDGWATGEEMWWSHQDEGLATFLSRLTGMSPAEAEAATEDFMGTWRQRGGPAESAALTRRFGVGVVGVLLAVASLAVMLTWAVARGLRPAHDHRTLSRGRREGWVPLPSRGWRPQ